MAGLARICKVYGGMEFVDKNGKKTKWLWDYAKDKAVLAEEMTKEEWAASEAAKWNGIKNTIESKKNNL